MTDLADDQTTLSAPTGTTITSMSTLSNASIMAKLPTVKKTAGTRIPEAEPLSIYKGAVATTASAIAAAAPRKPMEEPEVVSITLPLTVSTTYAKLNEQPKYTFKFPKAYEGKYAIVGCSVTSVTNGGFCDMGSRFEDFNNPKIGACYGTPGNGSDGSGVDSSEMFHVLLPHLSHHLAPEQMIVYQRPTAVDLNLARKYPDIQSKEDIKAMAKKISGAYHVPADSTFGKFITKNGQKLKAASYSVGEDNKTHVISKAEYKKARGALLQQISANNTGIGKNSLTCTFVPVASNKRFAPTNLLPGMDEQEAMRTPFQLTMNACIQAYPLPAAYVNGGK
jgi:hypothetical protein